MPPVTRAFASGTRRSPLAAIPIIEVIAGVAMVLAVIASRTRTSGPNVFMSIADKVADGLVPFRDFMLEYPPLALLPIAIPRFASGGSTVAYEGTFILIALVAALATAAAVAWLAGHGWSALSRNESLISFGALALAAAPMVLWRFDIVPALLTTVALIAVATHRPAWAGFALALGAAVKLYPAFLVPVFFAYYLFGRRWRGAAMLVFGFGAFMVGLAALLFAVAGTDGFTFLTYQEDRGVEIESVVAGLALAANVLFDEPLRVFHAFGSYQVGSPVLDELQAVNAVAMLGLGALFAVGLFWRFRADVLRHGTVQPQSLVSYLLAALLLTMLANKVLSPQYIVWLLPLGALLPWRKSLLLVVIFALTTIEFPIAFRALMDAEPAVVLVLNVRNALMLAMFLWLLVPQRVATFDRPPRRPAATPNMRSPIASLRRRGAINVISKAANVTVAILARVRPGRPACSAS